MFVIEITRSQLSVWNHLKLWLIIKQTHTSTLLVDWHWHSWDRTDLCLEKGALIVHRGFVELMPLLILLVDHP